MGPIARLNKTFTKDILNLAKDAFSDAASCDAALKEYERLKKEANIVEDDKLLFRTQLIKNSLQDEEEV